MVQFHSQACVWSVSKQLQVPTSSVQTITQSKFWKKTQTVSLSWEDTGSDGQEQPRVEHVCQELFFTGTPVLLSTVRPVLHHRGLKGCWFLSPSPNSPALYSSPTPVLSPSQSSPVSATCLSLTLLFSLLLPCSAPHTCSLQLPLTCPLCQVVLSHPTEPHLLWSPPT